MLLLATECRNAIGERYGVEAPATLIFDHPTVASLATWLAACLASGGGSSSAQLMTKQPDLVGATQTSIVALTGISCCFPSSSSGSGSCSGPAGFWQQAAAGVDMQTVVPFCKWDAGKCSWVHDMCRAGWVAFSNMPQRAANQSLAVAC